MATVAFSQSEPAYRKPEAVKLFDSSVSAMGGEPAWRDIKTAKTSGTFVVGGDKKPSPFEWNDDWSTGHFKSHREITKDKDAVAPAKTDTLPPSNRSEAKAFPMDTVRGTSIQAPAVAIEQILRDTSYGLSIFKIRDQASDVECVSANSSIPGKPKSVWCFSSNSLPAQCYELTNDGARPGSSYWKRISYDSFSSQDKRVYPSAVTVTYAGGKTLHVKILEISHPNPADSSHVFGVNP